MIPIANGPRGELTGSPGRAPPIDVALLFPPATDPRSPHLALPSLAASLRRAGVRAEPIDLDLESLLHLLEPARLAAAVAACEKRLRAPVGLDERSRLESALEHAGAVLEGIEPALRALRDEEQFAQPYAFHHARACIAAALELTAAAAGPVHYNIGRIRYDVEGIDPYRLEDLARATADPRLNLFAEFYETRVLAPFDRDRPAVVGVSILNQQQILPGLMLCRLLKERGHFVVVGGTVYSKFVPQLLSRPRFFHLFCDGVVAYEGETALLELLNQLHGKRDLARVPNFLRLAADGSPAVGPTHVEDVDALPTPDFDGLPLASYLAPRPVLPILTGKGCYFNQCKFCDIPFINSVSRKPYRVRSPERIAEDVATLQRRHGARHFVITDEALSPRLLLEMGEALRAAPVSAPRFSGYARFEGGFTADVCRRLYAMGVRKLFFGLESGSQATLDHMRKGYRLGDAVAVHRNCARAGIAFHLFSIVGFPEETAGRAEETLNFFLGNDSLLDDPKNSFDVHPFGLDLRTEYGEHPEQYGIEIDADFLAAQDFPISIERWRNARGLSEPEARDLIARFGATLRRRYRASRQFPDHLWPPLEEYAILYADYFDGRPFGYRYCLPADGEGLLFGLAWSGSTRRRTEVGVRVSCLTGAATVNSLTLSLLDQAPGAATTVADLLDTLAARLASQPAIRALVRSRLRADIDALLAVGALHLIPATTGAGGKWPSD